MRYSLHKRVFYPLLLLLLPLVGMLFSSDVNWTLFDFVVMGVLLLVLGLALDLVRFYAVSKRQRRLLLALVVLGFLLVWIELAVGIFN